MRTTAGLSRECVARATVGARQLKYEYLAKGKISPDANYSFQYLAARDLVYSRQNLDDDKGKPDHGDEKYTKDHKEGSPRLSSVSCMYYLLLENSINMSGISSQ